MKRSKYFYYYPRLLQWLGYGIFPDHGRETDLGPLKLVIYRLYSLFVFLFLSSYTVYEMLAIYDAWRDKRDINYQFLAFTLPGILVFSVGKFLVILTNNRSLRATMKMLEVDTRRFARDVETEKRYARIATVIFFPYFSLILGTMVSAMVINLDKARSASSSNATEPFRLPPLPVRAPWNVDDFAAYVVFYGYSLFGIGVFGLVNVFGDLLMVRIMLFTAGHFETLGKRVENVGDDALNTLIDSVECHRKKAAIVKVIEEFRLSEFALRKKWAMAFFTEAQFNAAMVNHLTEAIRYHQLLIRITKKFENSYTFGFVWQMSTSFYVIAVIMAHTMQNVGDILSMRFLNNLVFLTSVMWQLFIQTYSANEITVQALKVADGAYNSPWYTVEKDNNKIRKLLTLLIQKAQRPIVLKAAHFIDVSNDLFVAIMRQSYTIFTLIQSTMSSKNQK